MIDKLGLKVLDQSVFKIASSWARFAIVNQTGDVWAGRDRPTDDGLGFAKFDSHCELIGTGYDSINWEGSFIERNQPKQPTDAVDHPPHYTGHPSGVECIEITEHMGFNLGNALKYIWRCDLKDDAIEDLNKAIWYINREIKKREVSK